ncbi:TPA: restriction endonuclease subunit S [Listeria monocytogenes]|uniref:Restriction endonuclease subunit S n=3 Tax=Listeria monocytogenes TaxID=1639 RepID=A0A463FDI0_LISMN|nr:restriction endonuclease subunit S [Listeria monocytogenes]EAE3727763.1 restriction endonuclease subunit S [Listeria monocytogenes serotype 1/2b]AMD23579.1 restriction endonuclease subunit S [Listeria monocytogenes]AQP84632.1 type I restriction endonuclease subunit S [Listeria monocytogenes]ASH37406.1 type I restriction enzyme S subunit [Listeria monocytogenes serotype 1/2b str. 10-0811]ASW77054.1 restriction endonuclease subunit S [Listeria monocytogenes]
MLPLFYVISHYSNLPFRAWEQRKFIEIINRLSKTSNSSILPKVEYEDIIAEEGRLNKDISNKFDSRKGILFQPKNILYGKLRPYLKNWLYPDFKGVAVGDFWVFEAIEATPRFIYNLIQSDSYQKVANDTAGTKMPRSDWTKVSNSSFFIPKESSEQKRIGTFFKQLDDTIALHQRKLDTLKQMKKGLLQQMFPKSEEDVPKIRFADFDEEWYQRKLGEEFEKINERNDGSFGKTHWISVAKMYFVEPNKVLSNNIDTRTYVMRKGDIAFEGHSNTDFKFGRFVANDIGPGIVSELFPVYRHKTNYDNNYWKNAIQLEHIMAPIYSKSITSSGNSSNKLDSKHFLNQKIYIADFEEQEKIGSIFKQLDNTIILYQNKLNKFDILKKAYLQTMFI